MLSLLLVTIATILLDDVAIATNGNPPPFHSNGESLALGQDKHGGIPMGVSDELCDDGKTNLTIDWDGSISDFMCITGHWKANKGNIPEYAMQEECTEHADNPIHVCMDRAIVYHDVIPTSGAHRPLWAKYGEYLYLPKQRWLHNLEHGAAVFLFHPCADPSEIVRLERVARGCMRKHIITPYKKLTKERPFAVLTYGCRLQLPYVAPNRIRSFLRDHANIAPERMVSEDGQFDRGLILPARSVSDVNDCVICPAEAFDECPGIY